MVPRQGTVQSDSKTTSFVTAAMTDQMSSIAVVNPLSFILRVSGGRVFAFNWFPVFISVCSSGVSDRLPAERLAVCLLRGYQPVFGCKPRLWKHKNQPPPGRKGHEHGQGPMFLSRVFCNSATYWNGIELQLTAMTHNCEGREVF